MSAGLSVGWRAARLVLLKEKGRDVGGIFQSTEGAGRGLRRDLAGSGLQEDGYGRCGLTRRTAGRFLSDSGPRCSRARS